MADYSNVRAIAAQTTARHLRSEEKPTDERYLAAVEIVDPPLFAPEVMDVVRKELDPVRSRRGRRARGAVTAPDVGERLAQTNRDDLSPFFIDGLSRRLQGLTPRFTDTDAWMTLNKPIKLERRNGMIRGLYRDIYELLGGDGTIEHPIIGPLAVPTSVRTRSERALMIAHDLAVRFGLYPPALSTMRNIIKKNSALIS